MARKKRRNKRNKANIISSAPIIHAMILLLFHHSRPPQRHETVPCIVKETWPNHGGRFILGTAGSLSLSLSLSTLY
jgi:hypothetical protein